MSAAVISAKGRAKRFGQPFFRTASIISSLLGMMCVICFCVGYIFGQYLMLHDNNQVSICGCDENIGLDFGNVSNGGLRGHILVYLFWKTTEVLSFFFFLSIFSKYIYIDIITYSLPYF